jgi:hypothetical protein
VPRDDQRRRQLGQRGHGRADDRLEPGAGEVEAADDRVQPPYASEPHRLPDDVDHAGVAAASEHDKALAAHVDHECLVVDDRGVVLPAVAIPGLMGRRHAPLEIGGPVHLAGDQDAAPR